MVGGLLSRVAAICEDVEVIVVTAGNLSDQESLAQVRTMLIDAVALVDKVGVIHGAKGNRSV